MYDVKSAEGKWCPYTFPSDNGVETCITFKCMAWKWIKDDWGFCNLIYPNHKEQTD